MKKILKSALLGSLAGLSALALVACGNSDSTGTSADKTVKVGILQYMEHDSLTAAREGFVAELEANGYKEGENLTLDYQNAQGDQANLQTISEQLVGDNDLVLAIATPSAQSLATASMETPILLTAVTDPLSADLVDSIEEPGGPGPATRLRLTSRWTCLVRPFPMPRKWESSIQPASATQKFRLKKLRSCWKKQDMKWWSRGSQPPMMCRMQLPVS